MTCHWGLGGVWSLGLKAWGCIFFFEGGGVGVYGLLQQLKVLGRFFETGD